jgi:hypothetical protein
MPVVNGPQFPKLTMGRPWPIGTLVNALDEIQFSITAGETGMGSMVLHFLPNGTITAGTAQLRVSLDGGATFHVQSGAVGGSSMASTTGASAIAGSTDLNIAAAPDGTLMNLQIPSVGDSVSLRIRLVTVTYGTATKIVVWGLVG